LSYVASMFGEVLKIVPQEPAPDIEAASAQVDVAYKLFMDALFSSYGFPSQMDCAQERRSKVMSTQELFVQQFTKLFHHYTEALAPSVQQKGMPENSVSPRETERLVAAARLAILELETNGHPQDNSRRYYAKPGEAEWGC
jgi:hypothetical protein